MLNPNGQLAEDQYRLLMIATAVMLLLVVPLIIATLVIAWRYREAAQAKDYDAEFTRSKPLEAIVFYGPLITVAILGTITWVSTHRLDPYKPFAGSQPPLEIQVVGLDYKWLFIYPQGGIATVNDFVAPVGRPVTLRLTSDPMMTSIFVPGLVSQIYAMPGMESRSNFIAAETKTMQGANGNYNGEGFSNQRFQARLMSQADFDTWLASGKSNAGVLDKAAYDKLWQRSDGYPVTMFGRVDGELFATIVKKYNPAYVLKPIPTATGQMASADHSAHSASEGH